MPSTVTSLTFTIPHRSIRALSLISFFARIPSETLLYVTVSGVGRAGMLHDFAAEPHETNAFPLQLPMAGIPRLHRVRYRITSNGTVPACLTIDLMDLPVSILPDPKRSFGPREPRIATATGEPAEERCTIRSAPFRASFQNLVQRIGLPKS